MTLCVFWEFQHTMRRIYPQALALQLAAYTLFRDNSLIKSQCHHHLERTKSQENRLFPDLFSMSLWGRKRQKMSWIIMISLHWLDIILWEIARNIMTMIMLSSNKFLKHFHKEEPHIVFWSTIKERPHCLKITRRSSTPHKWKH